MPSWPMALRRFDQWAAQPRFPGSSASSAGGGPPQFAVGGATAHVERAGRRECRVAPRHGLLGSVKARMHGPANNHTGLPTKPTGGTLAYSLEEAFRRNPGATQIQLASVRCDRVSHPAFRARSVQTIGTRGKVRQGVTGSVSRETSANHQTYNSDIADVGFL